MGNLLTAKGIEKSKLGYWYGYIGARRAQVFVTEAEAKAWLGREEQPATVAAGEWIVMCRVSGGVTGTREAVLKANGIERTFATREEAEAEASRLMNDRAGSFGTAYFQYWAEAR